MYDQNLSVTIPACFRTFQKPIYHTLYPIHSSLIGCNTLPSCAIKDHPNDRKVNPIPKTHWAAKLARIMVAVTTHRNRSRGQFRSWQKSIQLRRSSSVSTRGWSSAKCTIWFSFRFRYPGWGQDQDQARHAHTTGNRFIEFNFRFMSRTLLLWQSRVSVNSCNHTDNSLSFDWSPSPN